MKFALILILLNCCFISAQNYESIRYFNKYNEISSDIIYNIEEDSNNIFWISTDNGVYKYNGNTFKKFTIKDGLPSNDIFRIKLDSKRRLWLTGFYNGLYYIYNDKVFKIRGSERFNYADFMYEFDNKVYFKNTDSDFFIFIDKSNKINEVKKIRKINDISYYKNKITIYNSPFESEKFILDRNKKISFPDKFIFLPNLSLNYPTFVSNTNPYIKNYNKHLKIINSRILYYKDGEFKKLSFTDNKHQTVKILNRDYDNDYSIFMIGNKINVFHKHVYDKSLSNFITNLPLNLFNTYFIFIDKSKNIWIITSNNQLIFIPRNYENIKTVKTKQFNTNEISIKFGSVAKDKHFVATYDNMFGEIDLKQMKFQMIDFYKHEHINRVFANKNEIIVNTANYLHFYNNVTLKKTKSIRIGSNKKPKIINNKIYFSNKYGINDLNGLIIKNKEGFRYSDFLILNNKIICSNENVIISESNKDKIRLPLKYTNVIEQHKKNIIVGTNSNGLYLLDENLKIINKANNIENICDIKLDNNFVYVLSTKSLFIYQIINKRFLLKKIITYKNGIINSKLNNIVISENEITIFSQNGISIINKSHLDFTTQGEIDFECNEFKGFNKNDIILERNQNNLNFVYNIATFENPNTFFKYYKLEKEGETKKWETLNSNIFSFKELNPGTYNLSLKLTSDNTNFKVKTKSIQFVIKPYFWETIFFKFLLFFLFLLLVYFIFKIYKNRQIRKTLIIQKMNDLELKALKSQMNPHFIFNILNNLQSIIFTKNELKINEYFVKFSKLMRSTLNVMKSDRVNLNQEIAYIRAYIELEQLRNYNYFKYEINIDPEIDINKIEIPVMIIQPIVENALEHGINKIKHEGLLIINIKKMQNEIIISVIDNGKGLDAINKESKTKQESYATKIIKERIKILNIVNNNIYKIVWIDLKQINKEGTQVDFMIKLNKRES